jgi:hypothetical protein
MKNKVEDIVFFCFHPIVSCMVMAKRTDLAIGFQDDFTAGMSFCQAAIYFGFLNDPWPNRAHDQNGNPRPRLGDVATPSE